MPNVGFPSFAKQDLDLTNVGGNKDSYNSATCCSIGINEIKIKTGTHSATVSITVCIALRCGMQGF